MAKKINYAKWTVVIIAIAIVVRFALSFLYTISGDACWHLSAAKFIASEHRLPLFEQLGRDEPFWAPPLFHFLSALFYSIFSDVGLKMVSPLFGSATLVIGFLIIRKFLSERAAFYAMLFFSFLPLMIDYSVLGYGESVLTFFVLLSVYWALEGRFLWSAVAAGFSILSKYNGAFIIPVLLFIAWAKSKKNEKWNHLAIICIIPALIASPWFIRNYIVLGNPFWPFLNFLFPSAVQGAYSSFHLSSVFSLETPSSLYLGFFGVPDGNVRVFSLIAIPHFWAVFGMFLAATLLFLAPLWFGIKKRKGDGVWHVLFGSFLLLFVLYVANVGPFVSRMLMPAVIALAIFYGRGADAMIGASEARGKKSKKWNFLTEKRALFVFVMICIGFVIMLTGKFFLASQAWGFYSDDFSWARQNTPKDAVFLVGGQCIQFHIERATIFPSQIQKKEFEYVWVNQDFKLDPRSVLEKSSQEQLNAIPLEEVYHNAKTGTFIYRKIG